MTLVLMMSGTGMRESLRIICGFSHVIAISFLGAAASEKNLVVQPHGLLAWIALIKAPM